jgi:hypothetical protein
MKILVCFVFASEIKCCFYIATVMTQKRHTYVMHTLSVLTSLLRGNLLLGSLQNKIFPLGPTVPTGPGPHHRGFTIPLSQTHRF